VDCVGVVSCRVLAAHPCIVTAKRHAAAGADAPRALAQPGQRRAGGQISHNFCKHTVPQLHATLLPFLPAQLASGGLATGGSVVGVLHMCSHGILFPQPDSISSVRYYLDDPSRKGKPVGENNCCMSCYRALELWL